MIQPLRRTHRVLIPLFAVMLLGAAVLAANRKGTVVDRLPAAVIDLQIVDAATKAVEDQVIKIYTFGNASAWIGLDLQDLVRAGLSIYGGVTSIGQWLGLIAGNGRFPFLAAASAVR